MFDGKKYPTGPERTELQALAEKLAYTDHLSAGAIEMEIAGRIRLKDINGGAAGGKPVDASAQLDEALKFIFDSKHVTTQAERDKWLPLAKELAGKEGATDVDVKWGLISKMQAAQDGDPKDTGTQTRMMTEAYKYVFGKDTVPPGEVAKWQQLAAEVAKKEGATATDIKWTLIAKMQDSQVGDPKNPGTMSQMMNEAYKYVFGKDTVPQGEAARWQKVADEVAKKEGATTTDIKWTLIAKMQEAQEGLDNKGTPTLQRLVTEALKRSYGPNYSPALTDRWTKFAQDMAKDEKTTATDIKWALFSKVQTAADGMEDTGPETLKRLVDDAFRKVLGDKWRAPSDREKAEWNKLATELAGKKMNAYDIQSTLIAQLKDALSNR